MKEMKIKSREALMKESLKEFSNFSYDNASLNRIIKSAQVSKGSFYYHFKNKEELYQNLLVKSVEAKWIFINEYSLEHQIEFDQLDIFDKFLYQAKAGILFAEKHPEFNQLAHMFSQEKGSEIYDKMLALIGGTGADQLKKMIHYAYDSKEISHQYDLDFVESILQTMFTKYDEFFNNPSNSDGQYDHLESFVKFLKYGLSPK